MNNIEPVSNELRGGRVEVLQDRKSSNQIINSLPLDEYNMLLSLGKIEHFLTGESVYRCGDHLTHFYFPLTTIFSQMLILEDGRTCETSLIGSNGCLGLPTSIDGSFQINCWAETALEGTALKISVEAFEQEFAARSILRIKLAEYTNILIRQLSQKIICNCFHLMKERFCSRLLIFQEVSGDRSFPATHESLARALGTHRPSVSGVAKQLEREKIISYSRGKIKILDPAGLEENACSCRASFKGC